MIFCNSNGKHLNTYKRVVLDPRWICVSGTGRVEIMNSEIILGEWAACGCSEKIVGNLLSNIREIWRAISTILNKVGQEVSIVSKGQVETYTKSC